MLRGITALSLCLLLCAAVGAAQPPQEPYPARELSSAHWDEPPEYSLGAEPMSGCSKTIGCADGASALWPPRKQPYIFVDYLYWKPTRQGLDYAIVDPLAAAAVGGDMAHVTLDRESGVRTGLGFRFSSGWDLGFTYTNLHSRGEDQVTGLVRAVASHPAFNIDAEQAAATAKLEYDVFDFELGRSFMADETLRLRMFGGVRGARIEQAFVVSYAGGDFTGGQVDDSINFDALGLRLGGEAHWEFCYGWGLFGRAAASLLTGQFETRLREADAIGLIVDVRDNTKHATPVMELAMGVSWEGCHWKLQSGYDFTNWFNMLERPVFHDDLHVGTYSRRQGNLGLDGFFLRLAHEW